MDFKIFTRNRGKTGNMMLNMYFTLIKRKLQVVRKVYLRLCYFYSDMLYMFHKNKYSKIIKSYKDKYHNQSCFIIGNGPSLSVNDLNLLKRNDIITFAANRIYYILNDTDWRPTFTAFCDEGLSKDKDFMREFDKVGAEMIFSRCQFFNRMRNMTSNLCFLNTSYSRRFLKKPRFSIDIRKRIYSIATITYYNMQIATYMGFQNIYLLGVDNKYEIEQMADGTIKNNKDDKSYYYKQLDKEKKIISSTYEMNIAYNAVKLFSENNYVSIYNATRGGRLELFHKIAFEDAISAIEEEKGNKAWMRTS